jgi:cathepsin L
MSKSSFLFFALSASSANLAFAITIKASQDSTQVSLNFRGEMMTHHEASSPAISYEDFLLHHGHRLGVEEDSVPYHTRRQLYHKRVAAVMAHNAEGRDWVETVNKYADFTDEERNAMLGYKRWARVSEGPSSFLQLESFTNSSSEPIEQAEVDWRPKLASSKFFRDQGSCGSCWAVASAGALEMTAEQTTGKAVELSYQQLVDCVENPKNCGGTGGCGGATAELAFEYVKTYGLQAVHDYKGKSSCKNSNQKASIAAWHRLPTNEGKPLKMAIMQNPVVVSLEGSRWFGYHSGIFSGCAKDATVNHAVLAVGYGKDSSKPEGKGSYWTIRNSWGQGWGENGHIRLLRHENDNDYCGTDHDPKQGVGCDGGPSTLPVCGMCGVLSDSSYPKGTSTKA